MRKTNEQFLLEIKDRPLAALEVYLGAWEKIRFGCAICGNTWAAAPSNILAGRRCPLCSRKLGAERRRRENRVLEDHGTWLLVDISTPRHPEAAMAVDKSVFESHTGGRISADQPSPTSKYIYASSGAVGGRKKRFHSRVIRGKVGFQVDHIIHGSMHFVDNRRQNLRLVSSAQNCQNCAAPKSNTSGVKGVYWIGATGKWRAGITINYRKVHLGCFTSIEDAAKARRDAEEKYFGEFAYAANNEVAS